MAGSIHRFPLRATLLAAAMTALLGACAGDRDADQTPAAEATPAADPVAAGQPDPAAQPATGSTPAAAADADTVEPTGPCNAESIQTLVGQEASEATIAKATADSGATNVRVLGPNDAATMDFRADRLTITTDEHRVIQTLDCG